MRFFETAKRSVVHGIVFSVVGAIEFLPIGIAFAICEAMLNGVSSLVTSDVDTSHGILAPVLFGNMVGAGVSGAAMGFVAGVGLTVCDAFFSDSKEKASDQPAYSKLKMA